MLDKPNLPDDFILASLSEYYGLTAMSLEFLPLGNETGVWVYRARTAVGQDLFLKLRRGGVFGPALEVAHFLHENGISQALAAVATCSERLFAHLCEDYYLMVYPFIPGKNGMDQGLNPSQQVEFGRILRSIHTTQLPAEHTAKLDRESYAPDPVWVAVIAAVTARVRSGDFRDSLERETAAGWGIRQAEIEQILARALELGQALKAQHLPEVLCHTDIHTANLLVDENGNLHVVDWDQPMLAPREHDLMFVVGSIPGSANQNEQERLFFEGYGQIKIDWTALAYYRYNWAVQEIADYARRVFLITDIGEKSRCDAAHELPRLFNTGNVVQAAYQADHTASQ